MFKCNTCGDDTLNNPHIHADGTVYYPCPNCRKERCSTLKTADADYVIFGGVVCRECYYMLVGDA